MVLSSILVIPFAALFLTVGSLLWIQMGGDTGVAATAEALARAEGLSSTDRAYDFLFPFYVIQTLPAGVRGLIIAAIFATAMSSLDSAIAALSTTFVRSIWQPYVLPGRRDSHYLVAARVFSVVFAVLLIAVAVTVWRLEGAGDLQRGFGKSKRPVHVRECGRNACAGIRLKMHYSDVAVVIPVAEVQR